MNGEIFGAMKVCFGLHYRYYICLSGISPIDLVESGQRSAGNGQRKSLKILVRK
jgi:hypothetical protein